MSGEVKAHGLEGNLVEPDWPALKLDELDGLLRRFPQAQKAQHILSFSPRPFSAASVVETPLGNVFVKRHHRAVRDRNSLLEEHRWLNYLSQRDTLVKKPLEDRTGETAVEIGDWTYEVHPVGDGLDLYETAQSWTPFLSVGHARQAGLAGGGAGDFSSFSQPLAQIPAGVSAPVDAQRFSCVESFLECCVGRSGGHGYHRRGSCGSHQRTP